MRWTPFALPVLLLATLALPGGVRAEEATLTLLHTTDLHGSLLPWDDLTDKPAPRGLARVATLVGRIRAEGRPVLLLDAGDATAGSPLTATWHRVTRTGTEPVTRAMNMLGYDAMALGNHEFDFGPAALESTRAAAHFPWLAANVAALRGGEPFAPAMIKVLPNGIRIGVIGLTTPAVPQLADSSLWNGFAFTSPIEAAKREVARLRDQEHCDVVIALAHTGLESDPKTGEARKGDVPGEDFGVRLAAEVEGLDVVILGHTHVVVGSQMIGGALVTQAGKWGEALGRVDLTLARAFTGAPWKLTARHAQVIAIGDSIPADSAMVAALAPEAAATRAAMAEEICRAPAALAAPGGRLADNPLWQLIHRAQLEASGADVSLAALYEPAQVIPAGAVHMRDLLRLYPYDNTLVVVRMTGAELKLALEQSARYLSDYTFEDRHPLTVPGQPGFNFDMASGVTYDVDPTRPEGSRIVALSYKGKPLAPDQMLRVAVNSYRASGGGGFDMIAHAPRVWASGKTLPELIVESARRMQSLSDHAQASWRVLPDYCWTRERPLIDRLVRIGFLTRAEALRLGPEEPVRRADLAYWLGRAFGWSAKPSASAAVGDSLAPFVAGALAHGVLGDLPRDERAEPRAEATVLMALDASERAARAAGYSLRSAKQGDVVFWRGLLQDVSLASNPDGIGYGGPLDRAQWLGILSNLRYPQVRFMETTDFHGNVFPTNDRRSGRPSGGTVALASALEHLRAENPDGTVLLDGGDLFQGTMISNLQFGRPIVEQMNLLGYTAAAIGNHDFDWTVDTLIARVQQMHFAALGANVVERKSGHRPWWVRADTLVTRRGVRIGILGLAYPGTPRVTLPANVAALRFEDDSTTAAEVAPQLRKAGAAVVVGVGHIPAETDSTRRAHGDLARLAGGVAGVDAWFGGHSHNVIDDRIAGRPTMISGAHGAFVAVVDMTVDPVARQVKEMQQRIVTVFGDDPGQDSTWVTRVQRWNSSVDAVSSEKLGRFAHALDRHRPEATIGDWICDAMRFSSGADIAMQNPGGMRADHAAGDITRGSLYEVMPFDNTIVTEGLTGVQVRQALEQALKFDRITQVAGIRYAVDLKLPAMGRITKITLADGSPLDDAKVYKVAVNNFMATGGDNYDALGNGRDKLDTGLIIRGAMEAYVRDRCKGGAELDVPADGRIVSAER